MPQNEDNAKLLSLLDQQGRGEFQQVKKTKAEAGGRKLPGGLEGAVATVKRMKPGTFKSGPQQGKLYLILYGSVVEPEHVRGVNFTQMYPLCKDLYNSYEDNLNRLFNDLKLIGYEQEIQSAKTERQAISKVLEIMEDNPPLVVFNTGTRARKDGSYTIFFQKRFEGARPKIRGKNEKKAEGYEPASEKESEDDFAPGDRVLVSGEAFGDGQEYTGTVITVSDEEVVISFDDDGTEQPMPKEYVKFLAEDQQDEEQDDNAVAFTDEIAVDDLVTTTDDFFGTGEEYTGTVVELNGKVAVVEFEDGTYEVPLENLALVGE